MVAVEGDAYWRDEEYRPICSFCVRCASIPLQKLELHFVKQMPLVHDNQAGGTPMNVDAWEGRWSSIYERRSSLDLRRIVGCTNQVQAIGMMSAPFYRKLFHRKVVVFKNQARRFEIKFRLNLELMGFSRNKQEVRIANLLLLHHFIL